MSTDAELPPSQADLIAAVAELNASVAALGTLVEENSDYLERKIAALNRADARRKRSIRLAFITIAADLLVTSIGLAIWHQQSDTNQRIQQSLHANYITQQQQADTRVRVLCPLYTVLLAAAKNPQPGAVGTPEQKARFDASVKVIQDGFAALGCDPLPK